MIEAYKPETYCPQVMSNSAALGEVGEYLSHIFGHFHFAGIIQTPPTRTFQHRLGLQLTRHTDRRGAGSHQRRRAGVRA